MAVVIPRAEQNQEGFKPGSAVVSFMFFKDDAYTQHPLSLLVSGLMGAHQVREAQGTRCSLDPGP